MKTSKILFGIGLYSKICGLEYYIKVVVKNLNFFSQLVHIILVWKKLHGDLYSSKKGKERFFRRKTNTLNIEKILMLKPKILQIHWTFEKSHESKCNCVAGNFYSTEELFQHMRNIKIIALTMHMSADMHPVTFCWNKSCWFWCCAYVEPNHFFCPLCWNFTIRASQILGHICIFFAEFDGDPLISFNFLLLLLKFTNVWRIAYFLPDWNSKEWETFTFSNFSETIIGKWHSET